MSIVSLGGHYIGCLVIQACIINFSQGTCEKKNKPEE